ncbi:hypothetical protein DFH07DRAFT_972130 [Mycena maculata]|uniref:DUF6699 domain-containing protein n=1 Tax=Mycena maculata TaxID=230809 RepID=A0AAD7HJ00_9AGAR|nr:hypothetical protein DFH07DRAFT_972130 [Mycena maculata]
MSPKQVQWKLTVDEYVARDSPESRISPLPSPPPTPEPAAPPLPPTPRPANNIPLPPILEVHTALTPEHALQLDFSFPSDAFRRNPQLTQTLLSETACTPPRTSLCVRIAAGMFKMKLEVKHTPTSEPVTVGDVLTRIQAELRQYDYGVAPPEAAAYMRRRIETVNGYRDARDPTAEAANIEAERRGDGRMVDHLLGHTLFAGLTLQLGQPDHCWQLGLAIPERYAAC